MTEWQENKGLDFVRQAPDPERVGSASGAVQPIVNSGPGGVEKPFERKQGRKGAAREPKVRAPLTPWEEYAHALLQANEASFVN